MRLEQILPAGAAGVIGRPPQGIEISNLAYDSRQAGPGTLFFCVPGQRSDGHDFAAQAHAAGAVALVVERPLGLGVPEVLVGSARRAMAAAAARFYRDPSSRLAVIGVTGTNGKTTTAFMVRALMEAIGRRCGLIGTVKSVVGGMERPAGRTTPEAIDLQREMRAMLDGGERCCAMEVSSHALALERTAGVHFAAAVFTNLTQDHLDFHGSMESYFQAKRRLFVAPERDGSEIGAVEAEPRLLVVNIGDRYGRRLAEELADPVTFGVECDADYAADELRLESGGTHARLRTPEGEHRLFLPLPGAFNVQNALGALAAAHRLGGEMDALLDALQAGVSVPGRFQPVSEGQDFGVIVDYAHTPDSLENVLGAAREIASGRVICVFGAGGDRDRSKRPLMGEVGARLADVVVLTSDNPRSEDPHRIIEEVRSGADAGPAAGAGASGDRAHVRVTPHRGEAIAEAIGLAQPGDLVLIAGKGHEQGIELADGVKVPFDDVGVAREALRAAGAGATAMRGEN